ncbi:MULTISPECIES: GNAT family N-acetyltransferase [Bacillaceae]|uniref:GNAT family N-acetyltransferase n=1 Tax=Evansella alkalicola TaxID=745819 RepID=A0ABS6JYL3_9BACI|nr:MULTISPECIES: GNAT family N-acetyltransferase [Bacillaceae]MBU9722744.1 GNAT family N-acetyltransferase [Bacillus alkalicola]
MVNFLGTPKIETERLILRKMYIRDTQAAFDHWLSDERVADHRVNAPHKSISETSERVEKVISGYEKTDFCYWGIELKHNGVLIGEIDFYNFDSSTDNCEVSYSIGHKWWNQGYGTEALKAVVEFGFKHMNLHKISGSHNMDNPASGRIMRKVGMEQEGMIRHMIRNYKNQYKDCAVCGILQEDYFHNNANTESCILKIG